MARLYIFLSFTFTVDCAGLAFIIADFILDRLHVFLVELRQVHQDELIVRFVEEQHLHVAVPEGLKIGRRLGQLTTEV